MNFEDFFNTDTFLFGEESNDGTGGIFTKSSNSEGKMNGVSIDDEVSLDFASSPSSSKNKSAVSGLGINLSSSNTSEHLYTLKPLNGDSAQVNPREFDLYERLNVDLNFCRANPKLNAVFFVDYSNGRSLVSLWCLKAACEEVNLKPTLKRVSLNDEEHLNYQSHHKKSQILKDLAWHDDGTHFALVDDSGDVSLWRLSNILGEVSHIYTIETGQRVSSFTWLLRHREYHLDGHSSGDTGKKPRLGKGQTGTSMFGHLSFIALNNNGNINLYLHGPKSDGTLSFSCLSKSLNIPETHIIDSSVLRPSSTGGVNAAYILKRTDGKHDNICNEIQIMHISIDVIKRNLSIETYRSLTLSTAPSETIKVLRLDFLQVPLHEGGLKLQSIHRSCDTLGSNRVHGAIWGMVSGNKKPNFCLISQSLFESIPIDVHILSPLLSSGTLESYTMCLSFLNGNLELRDCTDLRLLLSLPLRNGPNSVCFVSSCLSMSKIGLIGELIPLPETVEGSAEEMQISDNESDIEFTEAKETLEHKFGKKTVFYPLPNILLAKDLIIERLAAMFSLAIINSKDLHDIEHSLRIIMAENDTSYTISDQFNASKMANLTLDELFRKIYSYLLPKQDAQLLYTYSDPRRAGLNEDLSVLCLRILSVQYRCSLLLQSPKTRHSIMSSSGYFIVLKLYNAKSVFLDSIEGLEPLETLFDNITGSFKSLDLSDDSIHSFQFKEDRLYILTSLSIFVLDALAFLLKSMYLTLNEGNSFGIIPNHGARKPVQDSDVWNWKNPLLNPFVRSLLEKLLLLIKFLKIHLSSQHKVMAKYMEISLARSRIRIDSALDLLQDIDRIPLNNSTNSSEDIRTSELPAEYILKVNSTILSYFAVNGVFSPPSINAFLLFNDERLFRGTKNDVFTNLPLSKGLKCNSCGQKASHGKASLSEYAMNLDFSQPFKCVCNGSFWEK